MIIKAQLVLATLGAAQQVYLDAEGPTPRPQCKATRTREPEYTFTPFSHTLTDTVSLVTSLSYTTWGKWDPRDNSTATTDDSSDPYGQAAWTALWRHANPPNFTETELVLPPRDYFGPQDCYNFPKHFRFGVSSSASQIEGATADEGKSPSLMDILQDIERVAAMGVSRYAFSIAWTRILPFALPGTPVNQAGIDHYNDFFGSNLSTAAEPAEIGYVNGAYQNETFPAAFVNYAKIVLTHYADRVPVWYTYNEPLLYANNGKSIDHVIKSHAEVYHFYKEQIKGTGLVAADVYAAEHFNTFQLGPFANPLFLGADYPDSYKQTIADYVPLTAADLAYLNGTADYFSINHYTATVVAPPTPGDADSVRACAADAEHPLRPYCVNQTQINRFGWNVGYRSQSYVYTTPVYLRSYLGYVWNTWRRPVVITEFGFPVFAETDKVALADQLFDTPRSNYYLSYLTEVLKAIWEDGVDVAGAYAWSFADNWEFGDGASNFGIQTVNRTSQVRNYKKSFFDLVDFVKARGG
ncbi:Beta-glucosidase 34 like protein [Verticillium longisporum]|uniref:Beta-glucosidase 34 like protein n=1 Tax=Verticillium longisporum TaxID=100787 RepID=A0A8I2ZHR9_VERLO|nr:Beta-glucosidase 34 like protein [Verticillium longisporum]